MSIKLPRKEEFDALQIILNYNLTDEWSHWISEGEPNEGHIYNSLQKLQEYLTRCTDD